MKGTVLERFEDKYITEPNSGCWLWIRSHNKCGYGTLKVEGKALYSHRISYELFKGEIPEGMYVLHSCDVRCCVNPEHLSLGTQKENIRDMFRRGRRSQVGQQNSNSKLSAEDVLNIRRSYKDGACTQAELATLFGVTVQAIYLVVTCKTWN